MKRRGVWLAAACALSAGGCPQPSEPPTKPSATVTPSATTSGKVREVWAATDVALFADFVPVAYRVSLTIDPDKTSFSGTTEIDITIARPTDYIVVHARDLSVSRAEIAIGGRTLVAKTAPRAAFGAREGKEELVLMFAETVPAGTATLKFAHEAPFSKNLSGIYRVEEGGSFYAFSQMEPTDARRAFPCFDEPRYKTPFELVLDVPKGMVAAANAPEVSREERGATTRIRFAKTEPIPTYLFAIAVGRLDFQEGDKNPTPIRFVATKGRAKGGKETLEAAKRSLDALEEYFGRRYPFHKLDVASVPNFGAGAMENAGLVTFREELVDLTDPIPSQWLRRMQIIMAHELAHQWFGNLVTMHWWDDLWLNEGFATWIAPKIADRAFPGYGGVVERVLDATYAMNADVLPSAQPVRPKVQLSDQIREAGGWTAYTKGAAILNMLESWIGEETFQKGIRDYVAANAGKSITSAALFSALDAATKKPVTEVASSFLDQPGVPLVTVTVACSTEKKPASITVATGDASGGKRRWTMPICLRVEGHSEPLCTLVFGGATTTLAPSTSVPCPWVFPDYREAGYFRYELDPEASKRLVQAFASLDETERAGFILDAWALVLLGRAAPSTIVDIVKKVSTAKETSRVVVEAILNVLGELDRHYVDDQNAVAFRSFVKTVLEPHKKRLGMPKSDDARAIRVHRANVLATLFDLGDDARVARELEPIAKAYLADPKSADMDLGPLAVRISARAGGIGAKSLDAARLARAASPSERVSLVAAIASRKDPKALTEALELFATGGIRSGDWRHMRNAALRYRDTAPVFYAFMRDRFDSVVEKLGWPGAVTQTLGATCDAAELEKMTKFLEPKLKNLEGAQRGFDEGIAEATRCMAVRARGAPVF